MADVTDVVCNYCIHIEARVLISYKWFLTRHLNKFDGYSDLDICLDFLLLTGWLRVSVDSTSVYKFDSVVSGHHEYKTVWTPLTDETL